MKRNERERPSEAEAIEATAAAWLAQRDDGFSDDQAAEFARWRGSDARHEAAVARLDATWTALRQLRDFRPEARMHPDRDLLQSPSRGSRRKIAFPAIATAALAAALALAALGWFASGKRERDVLPQRFATTVDGYERVALADGSLLDLNSNSEVMVHFAPAGRRVRLVRGEAHFTVAKDPARPFFVEAGDIAVRAVGTAFNVRLGATEIEVLVTEGKVEVNQALERGDRPEPGNPSREERDWEKHVSPAIAQLGANERTIISMAPLKAELEPVIEKVAPDALREALAWQGPRLVFLDTSLAEVVAQFNRRNHVQLVLADAELESLPIAGSFRAENVDAFVRLLTSGGDIVSEQPDATRIMLRRKK